MSLRSLFIDFNSYFASCEQHLRPELRGKPVAVAPVVAASGCCIAASYEAKAFGVKTGMRVGEAMALCPKIEIVDARPSEYVRLHQSRIPLAAPPCPATLTDPLGAMDPKTIDPRTGAPTNACRLPQSTANDLVIHFENPVFAVNTIEPWPWRAETTRKRCEAASRSKGS